jgi:hypothetical protein
VIAIEYFEAAEERMRSLLSRGGLPQPDRVEYWDASVAFFWDEPKVVVAVDVIPDPTQEVARPPR